MNLPSNGAANELVRALSDPSIRPEKLMEIAWREYVKAGSPYGETKQGLAIWVDGITWTTVN